MSETCQTIRPVPCLAVQHQSSHEAVLVENFRGFGQMLYAALVKYCHASRNEVLRKHYLQGSDQHSCIIQYTGLVPPTCKDYQHLEVCRALMGPLGISYERRVKCKTSHFL